MTKDELNEEISYFISNEATINVVVYVILKGQEVAKKLDVKAEALPKLKQIFLRSISNEILPEELAVLPLSSSDDRTNVLYEYDLDIPEELAQMEEVTRTDDIELFDANTENVTSVKALLIEIGDNEKQIVLYKALSTVNVFGRSSFFLIKSDHRFDEITDEFIRIDPGFQVMRCGESLFVLNLKTIEKMFGFHDAVKREAAIGIEAITGASIIDNPDSLTEMLDDISFARKLTKIARNSPVINSGVSTESIIRFCKEFPSLINKIKFNEDESRIHLSTKVSKDLFIKLLLDDFLTSELTEYHYMSVAKDEANSE